MKQLFILLFFLWGGLSLAKNNLIVNGIPWYDNNDNIVNAHGACIVEENGRYYLFGEWKSDKSTIVSKIIFRSKNIVRPISQLVEKQMNYS